MVVKSTVIIAKLIPLEIRTTLAIVRAEPAKLTTQNLVVSVHAPPVALSKAAAVAKPWGLSVRTSSGLDEGGVGRDVRHPVLSGGEVRAKCQG